MHVNTILEISDIFVVQDKSNFDFLILFKKMCDILVSAQVYNNLDLSVRSWIDTLDLTKMSSILSSVYSLFSNADNQVNTKDTTGDLKDYKANTKASSTIGKNAEDKFARICRTLPDNYQVVNTAKQGKAGDFVIYYSGLDNIKYSCIIDIKKYSTTVPKAQLDKFYEDINYGNYDAGLIISVSSKFCGISDNIYVEQRDFSYGKIPIMYLAEVPDELITHAIKIILLRASNRNKSSNVGNVDVENVTNILNYINSALGQSATTRRMLSELNNTLTNSINKCQENLIAQEVQIKQAIGKINDILKLDNNISGVSDKDDDKSSIEKDDSKENVGSIDIKAFMNNDRNIVMTFYTYKWKDIDYCTYTFTNEYIQVQLEPLKSKTKIYIIEIYKDCEATKKLKDLFTSNKKGALTATFNNKLLSVIADTF
jgi:hypothetical protein